MITIIMDRVSSRPELLELCQKLKHNLDFDTEVALSKPVGTQLVESIQYSKRDDLHDSCLSLCVFESRDLAPNNENENCLGLKSLRNCRMPGESQQEIESKMSLLIKF